MSSSTDPPVFPGGVPPLTVECRFPHVCVAGYPTAFEVRVTGLLPGGAEQIFVEFSCEGLARGGFRWEMPHRLHDGMSTTAAVSLRPAHPGTHPITVAVWIAAGGQQMRGTGEIRPHGAPGLPILEKPAAHRDIHIGEKAFFGAINQDGQILCFKTINDLLEHEVEAEFRQVVLRWEPAAAGSAARQSVLEAEVPPLPTGSWKVVPSAGLYFLDAPVCQRLWREVTGKGFGAFISERDPAFSARIVSFLRDDMPVVGVQLEEAETFCRLLENHCRQLGQLAPGWSYRLPFAEEWLRARGPVPPEPQLDRYCYNLALGRHRAGARGPRPVADMRSENPRVFPNRHGLHGMLGDVAEWCLSGTGGQSAPLLGGSWHREDLPACRGIHLRPQPVTKRSSRIGFRVVAYFRAG